MSDEFNLERFKAAQDVCYHRVIAELTAGHKQSHWIWFIFPQISGLGRSEMDATYAIRSSEEAKAYLEDSLLGGRLGECVDILLASEASDITDLMGFPDDLKLRSSMTLFASVTEHDARFKAVLDKYYAGKPDGLTLEILLNLPE